MRRILWPLNQARNLASGHITSLFALLRCECFHELVFSLLLDKSLELAKGPVQLSPLPGRETNRLTYKLAIQRHAQRLHQVTQHLELPEPLFRDSSMHRGTHKISKGDTLTATNSFQLPAQTVAQVHRRQSILGSSTAAFHLFWHIILLLY